MGALFSRLKTWVSTEDVTYSDLNGEFDNILNNLTAANVDDFSANVAQMQQTADPGEVGSESLATSVAGEIQRLRQLIKEITGQDEWYESPASSIEGLANAIGSGLTDNRLVSGRVISGTQQPQFLTPNGAAATALLEATSTNFIYYIEGIEYSIAIDTSLTGLTTAPASNNTCLINDAVANDQEYTKYTGENGTEIPVDNMGSEITALVGKWAAFSLAGSTTEYFFAFVDSSTRLTKARRGFFFDSTDAAVPRAAYTNNDTITLLKLSWIFVQAAGTLTVTYNNPVWADDEPSSPSIGDYWFDLSTNKWMVRGASSWSDADAVLIGVTAQNTTACIAARSFEFFKGYSELNTCELVYESATEVHSKEPGSQVNVWGTVIQNQWNNHIWDITADRDSGVSETSSTTYFVYLTETGDTIISDIRPYDRREDLKGWYHPHKSWRCLGSFFNNSSSDIQSSSVESFYSRYDRKILTAPQTAATLVEIVPKIIRLDASGGALSFHLPAAALCTGQVLKFIRTDNTPTNAITLDPFGSETINGVTTMLMHGQYEMRTIVSDGSNWLLIDRINTTPWESYTPTFSNIGTVSATAMYWRKNGPLVETYGSTVAGTVAAGVFSYTMPHSIVSSANYSSTANDVCGHVGNAGGSTQITALVSQSSNLIGATYNGGNGLTKQNGNVLFGSSTKISFATQVTVDNWS